MLSYYLYVWKPDAGAAWTTAADVIRSLIPLPLPPDMASNWFPNQSESSVQSLMNRILQSFPAAQFGAFVWDGQNMTWQQPPRVSS